MSRHVTVGVDAQLLPAGRGSNSRFQSYCSKAHGLGRFGLAFGTLAALAAVACGPRSAPQPQAPTTESTTRALGSSPAVWQELGPNPITANSSAHGSGLYGDACSGATSTVIAHPTMPNVVYVVPTTGGVWRTKNYGLDDAQHPLHWEVLTDDLPSIQEIRRCWSLGPACTPILSIRSGAAST